MKLGIFLFLLFTQLSIAGDKGHGGGIHYCEGEGESVFYDLYEGREIYELEIPDQYEGSVEQILEDRIKKISKTRQVLADKIVTALSYFEENVRYKEKIKLRLIPDADIVLTDESCRYEQLANWYDLSGKVFVKQSVYDIIKDSNIDVAAFRLHEAAYYVSRNSIEAVDNSNKVRKFVAEVFSTSEIDTEIASLQDTYLGWSLTSIDTMNTGNLFITPNEATSWPVLSTSYFSSFSFSREECYEDAKVKLRVNDFTSAFRSGIFIATKDKNAETIVKEELKPGREEVVLPINPKISKMVTISGFAVERHPVNGPNITVSLFSDKCQEAYVLSGTMSLFAKRYTELSFW